MRHTAAIIRAFVAPSITVRGYVMVGQDELVRLAHLLRLSAITARWIADASPANYAQVRAVAAQVEAMAAELDAISKTVNIVPLLRPGDGLDKGKV